MLWVLICSSGQGGVVINEIHYHPKDKTRPTQFIELYNPDESETKIAGWVLDGGVTFQFAEQVRIPAHGFVIVAENPAAFKREFGAEAMGPWTNHLSHSTAELTLKSGEGKMVDEVAYGSTFPWPTSADGGGPRSNS